jgi:hypothetical protein
MSDRPDPSYKTSRQRAAVISVVMLKNYKYRLLDEDREVLEDMVYRIKHKEEFIPNNTVVNRIWVDPLYDGTGHTPKDRWYLSIKNMPGIDGTKVQRKPKKKKKRKKSQDSILAECYKEMTRGDDEDQ